VRVLLVGNHWTAGPGGAETMLLLTAELLVARGHTVLPFAVREERSLPAPTRQLFPPPAGHRARTRAGEAVAGVWSARAYHALDRVVTEQRPDVAHVHHVYERLTLSVLDVLRRRGVPTVMTLHDYKPVCPNYRLFVAGKPCTRCLSGRYVEVVRHRCLEGSRWRSVAAAADAYLARARGVYDAVDRFVAPSAFLRDRVVEGGLPAERVRVLPNPVRAADAPREAPVGPPRVLYAGRLVAEKGVHTLLDATALFPAGVRLTMVGSGRLEGQLRDRVRSERLPIDLLGATDPAGVARQLRTATAAVLPALWWENCPMAVLEAAAQGVPVVASAVGGVPELVEDGVTGRLVPAGDAGALAAAVAGLVADPESARQMGTRAWERVRERHDPDAHVAALVGCYEEVRAAAAR
jgi:glycosyltransferase involved in cell wall biosynthesis